MKLGVMLSAVALSVTLLAMQPTLASDRQIVLSVLLDGEVEGPLTPLIYVQGKLAGVAPGTVLVPLNNEGVALEIGVPQLSIVPLYSFVLTSSGVGEAPVLVTTTELAMSQDQYVSWNDAYLTPNTVQEVSLIWISENHYQMALPGKPFKAFYELWTKFHAEPFDDLWFARIPAANDQSEQSGYEHVVYDQRYARIQPLSTTREQSPSGETIWSGGGTPLLGSPFPTAVWIVESQPSEASGAEVWDETGYLGATEVSEELRMTESFFLAVHKDGFVDATYCENGKCSNEYCSKQSEGAGFRLICELAPVD